MATNYKQISYGSKGSDVKTLQEKLNSSGYNLDVDGVFGSKTQAAVKDYQQKNKLEVDGVVGKNTWGSLTGGGYTSAGEKSNQNVQAASTGKTTTPQQDIGYDAGSDAAYQQALAALQQAQQAVPTYQGTYDAQLDEIYNQIVNRDKFKYDLNGDALYQQYADQYQLMGQMAMMDTMGQAASMTGGYGNSYAQSVGQQAYQGYLQQLNEVVPELYGMARDQYNQEGQALVDQFAMVGNMADTEYGRYQDALNQYWQNVAYQDQQADEAYDRGYGEYMDKLNYQYQLDRDAVEDERYAQEFAYQKERDAIADKQWAKEFKEAQRQYNESKKASSGGGSSSSGSSSGGKEYSMSAAEYEKWNNMWASVDTVGKAKVLRDNMINAGVPEEMAFVFYEHFIGDEDEEKVDTTVTGTGNKKTGVTGGAGGKFGAHYVKGL